ncbi:hypothetical protein ADICYQ_3999 [Cyclobacterium qasimii M12-11B]|uniref:Uncharacterized protein n=1 Tax=Cyclobacterium qasimii M12-11B TaxID=641524 RepID=S7WS40_9BACT|nr:hypothetical protein ADICYQ_3999 [Cyclobacterium qasimii M12-11B]
MRGFLSNTDRNAHGSIVLIAGSLFGAWQPLKPQMRTIRAKGIKPFLKFK